VTVQRSLLSCSSFASIDQFCSAVQVCSQE
jgi:hypothetical protein